MVMLVWTAATAVLSAVMYLLVRLVEVARPHRRNPR